MVERQKAAEIVQTPFTPKDFDLAGPRWHWERSEIKVLKDLAARGYAKVDTFCAGKYRQDIIHLRSDEKIDEVADPFPIETLPYSFRKMIEKARTQGKVTANISTWLCTEPDRTFESTSNAVFRKDEVTLKLAGLLPFLSSTYLGRYEIGWVDLGKEPRFPEIEIIVE